LLLPASGCAGDLMYFATHTKVGVSITGTGDQISEATFGYDRFEGTFIPVRKDGMPGGRELEDRAPSVYSCSAVENRWLGGLSIQQTFATGPAATNAAKNAHARCLQFLGATEADEKEAD
jgi:hypothetical protein